MRRVRGTCGATGGIAVRKMASYVGRALPYGSACSVSSYQHTNTQHQNIGHQVCDMPGLSYEPDAFLAKMLRVLYFRFCAVCCPPCANPESRHRPPYL